MHNKIIAAIVICSFSLTSFSQVKYPIYTFGVYSGGFDGDTENRVLQFFSDSTFIITNYKMYSHNFFSVDNKTEIKGHYTKLGDTLFLNDSNSRFFPFFKEMNSFAALAKNAEFRLFPAKIILQKNKAHYISYLGIPLEIKSLTYSSLIEIEKQYKPIIINHGIIIKGMIGIKKSINVLTSPQISNKRNSF